MSVPQLPKVLSISPQSGTTSNLLAKLSKAPTVLTTLEMFNRVGLPPTLCSLTRSFVSKMRLEILKSEGGGQRWVIRNSKKIYPIRWRNMPMLPLRIRQGHKGQRNQNFGQKKCTVTTWRMTSVSWRTSRSGCVWRHFQSSGSSGTEWETKWTNWTKVQSRSRSIGPPVVWTARWKSRIWGRRSSSPNKVSWGPSHIARAWSGG